MRFEKRLLRARFIARPNRFTVKAWLQGKPILAHLHDPGRLKELLFSGAKLLLEPTKGDRKTNFDVRLVETKEKNLVSLYSTYPNLLLSESWNLPLVKKIFGPVSVLPEKQLGKSRIDFLLQNGKQRIWVEVKSVTLVENGVALFPDAPTARGRRHLEELIQAKKSGDRAVVLFVAQRSDAKVVMPNVRTDPAFARTLARALKAGVEMYAFRCRIDRRGIVLDRAIPIRLPDRRNFLATAGVTKITSKTE